MQQYPYWPAPAKLNLFMHITGRRADGYHLLQTVFQFLDIYDEIGLKTNTTGELIARHHYPGIAPHEDLTLRAAQLLQSESGCRQGAEIKLIKHLPVGGGVGGGSSDAATVLLVLNQLWDTGLTHAELSHLGLRLGADVPVFIHGRACWAEGVGENIQDIDLPEPLYLLVCPQVHVSTAHVFASEELTRNTQPIKMSAFLAGQGRNDCEAVVRRRAPAVDKAMRRLNQYAPARLTGTGCCVFAAFDEYGEAQRAAAEMSDDGWHVRITRGNNRSLLWQKFDEIFA